MKPLFYALLCSGLMALSLASALLITRNPFTY